MFITLPKVRVVIVSFIFTPVSYHDYGDFYL